MVFYMCENVTMPMRMRSWKRPLEESMMNTVRDKYPKNAFVNTGIAIARSHHEKL